LAGRPGGTELGIKRAQRRENIVNWDGTSDPGRFAQGGLSFDR